MGGFSRTSFRTKFGALTRYLATSVDRCQRFDFTQGHNHRREQDRVGVGGREGPDLMATPHSDDSWRRKTAEPRPTQYGKHENWTLMGGITHALTCAEGVTV